MPAAHLASRPVATVSAEKLRKNVCFGDNETHFIIHLPKICMLIEFSVSNFRSFRDRQTLSMVAAPRLRKKDNVISPKVKGETLPDLLKVAAVYGPNASGKINVSIQVW